VNEILSVGLILLFALAAGHAAQLVRIPEVTGYLFVGMLIGPTGLNLVTAENRETLQFLSEVALGLILFSIGAIFRAETLRLIGRRVATITLAETTGAFILVLVAMLAVGIPLPAALLLGVIAMETAPATTLMVLHEYDARGPLTDTLLALVAFNNMVVLIAFGIIAAIVTLFGGPAAGGGLASLLYSSVFGLVWGVLGSLALGAVLGLLLDVWADRVSESGEIMILAVGIVLVAVGGARWLGLSPLFTTLALGATTVNASHRIDDLSSALGQADPPLYAAFFVLAGAELRPEALTGIGAVGFLFVLSRVLGKMVGAYLSAKRMNLPAQVRRHLGLCLVSSSSLAIGLTIQVREQFPQYAEQITGLVLAAVIVFEIAGPLLTRVALIRAGEATTSPNRSLRKIRTDSSPVAHEAQP
jgi:Kef-type K+ transport system membrane component KefB